MAHKAPTAALPGFSSLGLDDRLVKAIVELGYEEPTPIQREAIPPLLEGKDLVGQAATGTGKTAAFALPLLHKLAAGDQRGASADGDHPGADTRAGHASGRGGPSLRPAAERQRAAHLRRAGVRAAIAGARARGRCGRRHAGTSPRPGRAARSSS